ncbi:MAG: GTPase ObgE [PVC group bacterium]
MISDPPPPACRRVGSRRSPKAPHLKKSFIDRARITARGGRGGDGCLSFRREKYVPRGGPDGGDGGDGGSVHLEASVHPGSLLPFCYRPLLAAGDGGHGQGKDKKGKNGKPLLRPVPLGTLVRDAETEEIIADLMEAGQQLLLARGGKGGRGNARFATSTRRAPRITEKGEAGEERVFTLELKLPAAVGLVGYPNAGKSTLLSAISRAHPRIAAYPFTTLIPSLGIVTDPEMGYRTITAVDIPGLIDGAHKNIGLGHAFLRHIERCRLLVFVLDMAGADGRRPADDYAGLRRELELHKPELIARPFLIAANKMDLPGAEEAYRGFVRSSRLSASRVLPISALKKEGLDELKRALFAEAEN